MIATKGVHNCGHNVLSDFRTFSLKILPPQALCCKTTASLRSIINSNLPRSPKKLDFLFHNLLALKVTHQDDL